MHIVGLVLYWQLASLLARWGSHIALLLLLLLTALGVLVLFRVAKLVEFVAGSWGDQR